MKVLRKLQTIGLMMICGLIFAFSVSAQDEIPKQRERVAQAKTDSQKTDDPADASKTSEDNAQKEEDEKDAAEIVNYYSNYMEDYRLGPEDVISVEVFGQCPDYCKDDLTIPPTARISYPLIREGIFVAGKTTFDVAEEITKKLDEYIIDPKVTVFLKKVGSARYGVVGKVETPGMRLMTRKVSVFEAIAEAGGVSKEGDKKHAVILRPNAQNKFDTILINLKDIEEGKAEMPFLRPGDQVLVPKQGFNFNSILDIAGKVSIFRILFGLP
ncbi:MAG: polysaccharide biosynthesis/export family protein [Pyrinomonadaceae bacterium]